MNEIKTVTVRPGVGMLALFPSMNYKPWYAVGEFVDNAIQSWLAHSDRLAAVSGGRAHLRVEVEIDRSAGTIVVTDNAAGIYTSDIGRAFTPAAPPADASGLSQFGIGMKSAAAWYAKRFVVTTTAIGENVEREVDFDIPRIVEAGLEELPLTVRPAHVDAHGTRLVLSELNHTAPTGRTLGKIREYLSSIYRRFLAHEDIEMLVNGTRLRYQQPDLLSAPRWNDPGGDDLLWRKDVELVLPSGRTISGWAGLLEKGETAGAGFALLYRGKVVQGAGGGAKEGGDTYKPREIFGATTSFAHQRLIGELDVSEIGVTHTKDSLLWDLDDEEAFFDGLAGALDEEPMPLLKMARNHRSTERGRAVQSTVLQAVDAVARAAELSAQGVGRSNAPEVRSGEVPHAPTDSFGASFDAVPPRRPASPEVAKSVPLTDTAWGVLGEHLRIAVVDDEHDTSKWLRVVQDGGTWIVTVNRAHRFTQSFAYLPGMDLEPVLRLAIAIALAQIRAERSGSREPRFFVAALNQVLAGPLAERNET